MYLIGHGWSITNFVSKLGKHQKNLLQLKMVFLFHQIFKKLFGKRILFISIFNVNHTPGFELNLAIVITKRGQVYQKKCRSH